MSPIARLSAIAAVALGVATGAFAHPRLVASTPAANAVVASPARIELHFSEQLVPQFSQASLAMTAVAPGAHPPAVTPLRTGISHDRQALIIVPQVPLVAGTYRVSWHAVSVDTHRVEGSFSFRVG